MLVSAKFTVFLSKRNSIYNLSVTDNLAENVVKFGGIRVEKKDIINWCKRFVTSLLNANLINLSFLCYLSHTTNLLRQSIRREYNSLHVQSELLLDGGVHERFTQFRKKIFTGRNSERRIRRERVRNRSNSRGLALYLPSGIPLSEKFRQYVRDNSPV